MRDYSQYAQTTPSKKYGYNGSSNVNHNRNQQQQQSVTPSPASSSASFPTNNHYRQAAPSTASSATATRSQVALLNRSHAAMKKQQPQPQRQQRIPPPQVHSAQKRDAASVGTAATQSSNDHSPRSNSSVEGQQQQQGLQSNQQQPQPPAYPNLPQTSPNQQQQQEHNYQHVQNNRTSSIPSTAALTMMSSSGSADVNRNPPHATIGNQGNGFNHTAMQARDVTSLNPADVLSLRHDGPEATILHLRQSLEEAQNRDTNDKSKMERSDATILELRSSVRQLKRQLEKLDGDARQKHTELNAAKHQLHALKQQRQPSSDDASTAAHSVHTQQTQEHALAKEERVGELQVQLDRAHAQILTADMVRKELEDTLEAEQYTWELRVQDQERTIVDLQQEMGVLAEDLEQCRSQWKQADEEWAKQVSLLEQQLSTLEKEHQQQDRGIQQPSSISNSNSLEVEALQGKMQHLENERNELQTCLDEALLELEAVDAELGNHTPADVQQLRQENQRLQEAVHKQRAIQQQQQLQQGDADFDTLEGLQYLYKWLLERSSNASTEGGEEKKSDNVPQTSPELLDSIHHLLENMPSLNDRSNNLSSDSSRARDAMALQVGELQSQLSVYRSDLEAREQSSSELRASLKEAVALIKPLQDAVDKADQQKADLQHEVERLRSDHDLEAKEMQQEFRSVEHALGRKEKECEDLQHDIHRLQLEVKDAKELATARQTMQGLSPTAAAAGAAAARTPPPSEQPQELSSLSKARTDLRAKRAQEQTLRSLLRDAQNRFHTLNQTNESVEAKNQQLQGRLRDAEEQHSARGSTGSVDDGFLVDVSSPDVPELEHHITSLKETLQEKNAELEALRRQVNEPSPEVMERMQHLDSKLAMAEDKLKQKHQAEKVLNRSLKDALGLLKPLKTHLEEAEGENKELSKEVRTLRRKVTSMEIGGMGTVVASPNNSTIEPKTPPGVGTPTATNVNEKVFLTEKKELEETVRHLEQENSQLHDALDEMSRMNNSVMSATRSLSPHAMVMNGNSHTPGSAMSNKAEARMNQEIVELKSRYEVTHSRLEDAYVENHTLVEALKEKEESEKDAVEGMRMLQEKLRKAEMDLENAKYIATSALVKVEQAKSAELNISMNSAFGGESHTVLSLEDKAVELDLMAVAGMHSSPSAPSPSSFQSNNGGHRYQQQQQQHYHLGSPRQQQPSYMSGNIGGHPSIMNNTSNSPANSWAGKRSRLADF